MSRLFANKQPAAGEELSGSIVRADRRGAAGTSDRYLAPRTNRSGCGDGKRAARHAARSPRAVAALVALSTVGCDVTIAEGLPAGDAARLTGELNQHGVAAHETQDGSQPGRYRVDVTPSAVASAFAAMRAQQPAWQSTDTSSDEAPLLPTKRDEQLRIGRTIARDLARTLELLPGVIRASVHVAPPAVAARLENLGIEPGPSSGSAAILLIVAPGTPSAVERVRTIVAAAVPSLAPTAITVVEQQQTATGLAGCVQLARLGPITLAPASMPTLKLWIVLALLVQAVLAGALLVLLRRQKQREREPHIVDGSEH